jgi:hypothetical protein
MFYTVCGYTDGFTIWSHRYIKMGQIRQNMDNFIFDSAEGANKLLENQANQVVRPK